MDKAQIEAAREMVRVLREYRRLMVDIKVVWSSLSWSDLRRAHADNGAILARAEALGLTPFDDEEQGALTSAPPS